MANVNDDPFASMGESTIIMPTPKGRPAPSATMAQSVIPIEEEALTKIAGLNPLVAAANPLLNTTVEIRSTLSHPNPAALRDQLAQQIKSFEARARSAGVSSENSIGARYALCTMLDEAAASTPWGGSGVWARQSLLVMFHNETWGGEKFFQLLSKLAEQPDKNRELLQLLYVCLCLGFEGRYRVLDNGRTQLEALRERLATIIQGQTASYERELSLHWRGAKVETSRFFRIVPLWVMAAISGVVLTGVYLVLNYKLNRLSDPVFTQISSLSVPTTSRVQTAPASISKPRLAAFLQQEIKEGLVTVRDEASQSTVTIRGDGFFQPGSTQIAERYVPLLDRIATALNSVAGQVQVTGHTDNQPIRSLRFPSNWHLSKARAESVAQRLSAKVAPERLLATGKADSEPIVPNDSAANRARNRRVEITLLVTGRASQ